MFAADFVANIFRVQARDESNKVFDFSYYLVQFDNFIASWCLFYLIERRWQLRLKPFCKIFSELSSRETDTNLNFEIRYFFPTSKTHKRKKPAINHTRWGREKKLLAEKFNGENDTWQMMIPWFISFGANVAVSFSFPVPLQECICSHESGIILNEASKSCVKTKQRRMCSP